MMVYMNIHVTEHQQAAAHTAAAAVEHCCHGGCTLRLCWMVYRERDVGVDVSKVVCPALSGVLYCQRYNRFSGLSLLPGNSGNIFDAIFHHF